MRVLFVDTVCELGGAQRSLLELAGCLTHQAGVEVVAALPPGPLTDGMLQAGIRIHPLPAVRLHRGPFRLLMDSMRLARGSAALRRIVRNVHPDLLHANGLAAALMALRAAGDTPVIWHVRDLSLAAPLVRTICGRMAAIVAVSESVDERLYQIVPPFDRGRLRLIHNGIDTRHFVPADRPAARQAMGLPVDAPLVGMAAHLVPWKRHDLFIEMAALLHAQRPDVHFAVAGRDLFGEHPRLRAQLDAAIAARQLSGVWHWMPPLDDLASWLPALDVLVHPATNEPFGRVLCEAMSCARPVVAADAAGPSCIVPHGVAGFLVPPGRADLFAARVMDLLRRPDEARRMGAAARAHVTAHFDVARVAAEVRRLYAGILAELARNQARRALPPDDERQGRRLHDDDDDD